MKFTGQTNLQSLTKGHRPITQTNYWRLINFKGHSFAEIIIKLNKYEKVGQVEKKQQGYRLFTNRIRIKIICAKMISSFEPITDFVFIVISQQRLKIENNVDTTFIFNTVA